MKHTVKKTLVASVASALVMGGTVAVAAGMDVPIIKATPVLEGLDKPWDMAVRADGTMFFTEKCKGLSMRSPNGQVTNIYGMKGSSGY
jgi:glucose/arabinose dehydrogenase